MTPLECRPGVLAVHVRPSGIRKPVAECASCELVMPIEGRGLCQACIRRHRLDGTIRNYGWTRADRLAEYAALLDDGLEPAGAAARVGVSRRTGHRYEAALRELRAP